MVNVNFFGNHGYQFWLQTALQHSSLPSLWRESWDQEGVEMLPKVPEFEAGLELKLDSPRVEISVWNYVLMNEELGGVTVLHQLGTANYMVGRWRGKSPQIVPWQSSSGLLSSWHLKIFHSRLQSRPVLPLPFTTREPRGEGPRSLRAATLPQTWCGRVGEPGLAAWEPSLLMLGTRSSLLITRTRHTRTSKIPQIFNFWPEGCWYKSMNGHFHLTKIWSQMQAYVVKANSGRRRREARSGNWEQRWSLRGCFHKLRVEPQAWLTEARKMVPSDVESRQQRFLGTCGRECG